MKFSIRGGECECQCDWQVEHLIKSGKLECKSYSMGVASGNIKLQRRVPIFTAGKNAHYEDRINISRESN